MKQGLALVFAGVLLASLGTIQLPTAHADQQVWVKEFQTAYYQAPYGGVNWFVEVSKYYGDGNPLYDWYFWTSQVETIAGKSQYGANSDWRNDYVDAKNDVSISGGTLTDREPLVSNGSSPQTSWSATLTAGDSNTVGVTWGYQTPSTVTYDYSNSLSGFQRAYYDITSQSDPAAVGTYTVIPGVTNRVGDDSPTGNKGTYISGFVLPFWGSTATIYVQNWEMYALRVGEGQQTAYLTVTSTPVSGLFTNAYSGGKNVLSGWTPVQLQAGVPTLVEDLTVSDWSDYRFDHWENGSTQRERDINLSSSNVYTVTATFTNQPPPNTYTVTVNSSPPTGMYTTLSTTGGSLVESGFTQKQFFIPTGTTRVVSISDYSDWYFDRWSDGNINRQRTVTSAQTLSAIFDHTPGPSTGSAITIQSRTTSGATLNGMYFTVNGASHFTPDTIVTTSGQSYTVVATSSGGGYTFDHWDNGSTNTSRVITATSSPQTFTVYYD